MNLTKPDIFFYEMFRFSLNLDQNLRSTHVFASSYIIAAYCASIRPCHSLNPQAGESWE